MVVLFCSQRHSITFILLQGEERGGSGERQSGEGGGAAPRHLHARPAGRAVGSRGVPWAPAPPGIPGTRGRVAPAPGPLLCAGTLPGGSAPALPSSRASLARSLPTGLPASAKSNNSRRVRAPAPSSAEAAGAAAEGGRGRRLPAPSPARGRPRVAPSALQWAGSLLRWGRGRGRKGWSREVLNFPGGHGEAGQPGADVRGGRVGAGAAAAQSVAPGSSGSGTQTQPVPLPTRAPHRLRLVSAPNSSKLAASAHSGAAASDSGTEPPPAHRSPPPHAPTHTLAHTHTPTPRCPSNISCYGKDGALVFSNIPGWRCRRNGIGGPGRRRRGQARTGQADRGRCCESFISSSAPPHHQRPQALFRDLLPPPVFSWAPHIPAQPWPVSSIPRFGSDLSGVTSNF